MAEGKMVVQLFHQESGTVISSVIVPNGQGVSLTGAVDLPEGDSTLCVRMYPYDWDGWGDYDGAGLQVIVGQIVDEQGCVAPSGGCS